MRERLSDTFPFAIAVVLPPAGLILGVYEGLEHDRDLGVRLCVVAIIAGAVWSLLLL